MAFYQAGGYYNNQTQGGYPYPQPGYPQPPGPGYNAYNANNYGYPMQPQQHQMQQQVQFGYNCGPCPQPMNMPQSMMTNQMMANNYAFNMHALNMNVARQMGLLEGMPAPAQVDEGEKEEDRRKREEEIAKEIEAKIAEKLESDQSLFEEMRQRYIDTLQNHLIKYGTLEPTEGSIKPFDIYPDDDPVVTFYKEYDGEDLAGKSWNAEADVCYLREAMKGAGTDEDAIIHVVASRCNSQRQTLKQKFKTNFGKDLIEDLKSELSGDFKECIMALFVKPAYYDAWCIKHAIKGLGTDERSLIEILMTRTNAQIKEIRDSYGDVSYPTDKAAEILEDDIRGDTSGDFRKLLVSACQGDRYEINREQLERSVEPVLTHDGKPTGQFKINFDVLVDIDKAKRDAAKLVSSGEGRLGTDEEQFNRIFSTRELYQMRRTYSEYVKLTQRDILNSIERETSGDFEKGLYACIMNIKCRPMYFAERLVQAMKGLGTNESDLIRIIVSRSEIDMVQIKQCFLELTKQTLWNWIKQDCSGDFKKILQELVRRD